MASLAALPVELLDAVCGLLSPCDLCSLVHVCSRVSPVAQRRLYRTIFAAPAARNLSVVLTLARNAVLAQYVTSFSINLDSRPSLFLSFFRHLAVALGNMTSLVHLCVFVPPRLSWVLLPIKSCPSLVHFSSSFPFTPHLATFLKATPSLLKLEVDTLSPSFQHDSLDLLPPSSVPLLSHFTGSAQAARAVVPGRPVQALHLTTGPVDDALVDALAQSTADLAVVEATTPSFPASVLHRLSQRLHQMMYLRISSTCTFSGLPDTAFYQDLSNALSKFPALEAFELDGMLWGSVKTDHGRIWQSKPLDIDFGPEEGVEPLDSYSDFSYYY
ncbi:hypothetical protein IW261DRAFT_1325292 [Armillaria novae-zelandiae]|uniref:F-box domain-containing protein n=1 Tax=Armillaria novae-zelandiae TaxID=153914 RepID=A0AA39PW67_9AGAR|nr:hypothetical protein IW261DRAFT_1325292 [Armillaria novae-zelandiae]